MIMRKNIWPKTFGDFASMMFILAIVPLIYWFELWIVLPEIHEYGSVAYFGHFAFGNFLMMNIVGNFTYTVLCDTSTRRLILATRAAKPKDGWRFCSVCESVAPPRSWHCSTCDACILKRDHHCVFTGCCIGYRNHRYFLMFLLYLFVATCYAFIYNNFFIWGKLSFDFPAALLKIIFPLAYFVFGFDPSVEQIYLILYVITAVGVCYTGALGYYHVDLVMTGAVAAERAKNTRKYDLGWRRNVVEALGERWYVAWIAPYLDSRLLHDGVIWSTPNAEASRANFKSR